MLQEIERIQKTLAPLRTALLEHAVYAKIDSVAALSVFMEHHIFGVWDFMSLLKTLQRRLCCVDVPWLPPEFEFGTRLVNEIVLGEESDEDGRGGYASHFALYHRAMRKVGASTAAVDDFLDRLRGGADIAAALESAAVPAAVRPFLLQTFDIIATEDLCAIAAAFTFGREDLLPDVFQRIVDELNVEAGGGLDDFQYYLVRHIELDGDQHGPMAERLLGRLCDGDPARWRAAEEAAANELEARLELWNGIERQIAETVGCDAG